MPADASPPLFRRPVLWAGVLVAVAVVAALAWRGGDVTRVSREVGVAGGAPADGSDLRTPADLLAYVRRDPGASLVVWDADADSAVVSIRPDAWRPVGGLPTLLLVAELARRAGRGIDTTAVLPASAVEQRGLPEIDPAVDARGPASLAGLARRALRADRAAADVLLWALGREQTDALPARFGLDAEAPLPLDGLFLAWAPASRPGPRDSLAASFLALDRPAQRDSAFAWSLAYVQSPSTRAVERARLERGGLGLGRAIERSSVRATLPHGTAGGYARLLRDALRGRLVDADISDGVLDLLMSPAATERERSGVFVTRLPGLHSAAGVARAGRAVVLILESVPDAVSRRIAERGLDESLVREILRDRDVGVNPSTAPGES